MMDLLPYLGEMQPPTEGQAYHTIDIQGHQPPPHLEEPKGKDGKPWPIEKLFAAKLAWLRSNKPHFPAVEAFCAVISLISARKERLWLELFGTLDELDQVLKKKPFCKSKNSVRRMDAIHAFIEKESSYGNGYFADCLIKPNATLRVAFAPGNPGPKPAVAVVTERVPLFNAVASPNDDNGDAPLAGAAKTWAWCMQPGRQFAFQEVNFDVPEEERNCRVATKDLQPDDKLRELIQSGKPVVYLEIVAALAPRDLAKQEGHSAIVKAELAKVMRDAKSRGEAVVLTCGSSTAHDFAKKVYMRQPISDYGLRCGYLRWRESADVPWATEKKAELRPTLCLQMP